MLFKSSTFSQLAVAGVLSSALLTSAVAGVAVSVPGTSNPWLAGMPDGTQANFNDFAPGQSPVEITGLGFAPGEFITFFAAGDVSNGPCCGLVDPDGGSLTSLNLGAEHGMSDATAPINALMGVFLDASQPDSSPTPANLDFGAGGLGTTFAVLSPGLKQVFFIGDGLDGNGDPQSFEVPAGATRLFLGTMDSYEWNNNLGSFRVAAEIQSGIVPEASTTVAAACLSAMVGFGAWRRATRR